MLVKIFLPVIVTLGLLAGFQTHKSSFPTAVDATDYHERVKQAISSIPSNIGPWVGRDVPIPPAATKLLQLNAHCSRRYQHQRTGRTVDLLLVQSRDSGHMAGHYPPICYPRNGWTQRHAQAKQWTVNGQRLDGVEYEFYQVFPPAQSTTMIVANALILPDGKIVGDMDAVRHLASDYLKRFFGAAQLQVVLEADIPSQQRNEIVRTFLGATLVAVRTIQEGVDP